MKTTRTVELTAYELGELTFALWQADGKPDGDYTRRFADLRSKLMDARVALFAADRTIEEYDRNKLVIDRNRYSTTQGSVRLTYDGTELNVYGDQIELKGNDWSGHDDNYWHDVAHRDAGRRGLCG